MNLEEKIIKLFSGNNFTYKLYGTNKWVKLYESEIEISVLKKLCKFLPNATIEQNNNIDYNYFKIQWK